MEKILLTDIKTLKELMIPMDNNENDVAIMPSTEMATVARNEVENFIIVVTPDTGRSDAYFKFCNHKSYVSCTHVIRLDFREPKYHDHSGDGKQLWKLSGKEIKKLNSFMRKAPTAKARRGNFQTNWQLAIFLWNFECGFVDNKEYDESFPEGCSPNSMLYKKPQFVPLNTPMPDYTKIQF